MKRRIIAMLLVLVIAVTAFSGCGLVTVNSKRASEEAVISVGSGLYADSVKKSDIVNLFYSYGWYYVYYYSMSVSDVVQMLIESRFSNVVMTYSATENLEKINSVSGKLDDFNKYDVFLTAEEIAKAESDADASISTSIDSTEVEIIKALITDAGGTVPDSTIRTTPTDFSYVSSVPVDYIGTDTRSQAVAKFKRLLVSNNSTTYEEYREELILQYKKSAVLTKYQEKIYAEVDASDEDVTARYNTLLAQEKEKYALSDSAYVTKLEAIQSAKEFSGSNFALYAPKAGYGLALNLLIKFDDDQAAKIKEWTDAVKAETMTSEEYEQKRAELAKEILAEDQRTSWLTNYGYNTTLFDGIKFDGTATPNLAAGVQTRDEYGLFKYDELTTNKISIDSFMSKVNSAVNGTYVGNESGYDFYKGNIANLNNFIDLIWAYGEDTSFNSTVGYVCYADDEDSGFVPEYAEATRLLALKEEGSYVKVVTDYGVHIVYLVKSYDKVGVNDVYVSAEKNTEGTFSNLFFNSVNDTLKSNYYSERSTAIASEYTAKKNFVKTDETVLVELVNELTALMS